MAAGSKDLARLSRPGWERVSLMAVQRRAASRRMPLMGWWGRGRFYSTRPVCARGCVWSMGIVLGCGADGARMPRPAGRRRMRPADNSRMLFLLSPAKSLDYETPAPAALPATQAHFEGPRSPAAELIRLMRQKSPQQVADLMSLSDKLAGLNV